MPVSRLDPKALASLPPSAIADLALASDQTARRLAREGRHAEAAEAVAERDALADIFARK